MHLLAPSSLGLCLIISPQLLGGAYGWGIAIGAALAGLACAIAAWSARADGSTATIDRPSAMLLVLFAWTAVQALALPRALTSLAQPEAVAMADATAKLISTAPPSWVPLSLSPGSTRTEVVKGAAIVASFFAAWLLVSLGHRRRVAQLVALSTLTMALVALAHLAAGAELVFGVYAQRETGTPLLAPLLNPNHLSGFLSLGVPLAIGLALDESEPGKRIAYLTAGAVTGATALLAVSRGGVLGLFCGLLALGAFGLARWRRGVRAIGTAYATIGAAVAAIAALGLYVGAEALYQKFERGDTSKLELSQKGLALALDHPWFGVGRGAFSAAFVSQHGSDQRFTHPENLLAQWTSEWGVFAALALFGVLAWALLRSMATARSWTQLGAAAGVIAIVVHDMVDFALEMSGVAVVAAALLATAIASRRRSRTRRRRGRVLLAWQGALGVGIVALVASLVLGPRLDRQSAEGLESLLIERMDDATAFRETLLEALRLHPAEPVFPLLAGARAVRWRDEQPMPWLNRAMALAPGWASPHLEAAHFLAQHGRASQALLELREADERQPGTSARLTCAILEERPELTAELLRITSRSPEGIERLERVARCLPLEHDATAAIDARLMEDGANRAHVRSAQRRLDAGDARGALTLLEPIQHEADLEVQLARARMLVALEEHEQAARVLERAEALADRPERLLDVLFASARARAAAGDAEGMRAVLERARDRVGGRARRLASIWMTQGQLEERLGNEAAALAAYHRAHRLDADSAGLARVARITEQSGDFASALRAYEELCQRRGEGSGDCAARDRVARRLAEEARSR